MEKFAAFWCIPLIACLPTQAQNDQDTSRAAAARATLAAIKLERPFAGDPTLGWDDIDDQGLMHRRFWSTRLKSKCAPSAFYAHGAVPPAFYNWPYPPEAKRREACLTDEIATAHASFYRLAIPSDFPRTGTCYRTKIKTLYSGAGVLYENGIRQFDWQASLQLVRSHVGDRVRVCVTHLPENCPAHDLRGITYRTRNLRTGESWELGADQHMCWGA